MRLLVRFRYLVLLAWGSVFFSRTFARTGNGLTDWRAFEGGARVLLSYHHKYGYSGGALHLYANYPFIQIGPPALLPLTPFQAFQPLHVALAFGIVMSLMGLLVVYLCERVAVLRRPGDAWVARGALLGGLAVTAAWSHDVGLYRHLDDAMAITMAVTAAWVAARRGSWWWVALLLGTACATKPWAVVLVPVIGGLARTDWVRTFAGTVVVGALWWLPFLLASPTTIDVLAGYHLFPRPGSVLFLVGVHGRVNSWLRPTQTVVGLLVGILAVSRGRWLAAPLVGVAVRVALDPYSFSYYGMGPMAAALMWDLQSTRRRWPMWTTATVAVEYLLEAVAPAATSTAAVFRGVWALTVVLLLAVRRADKVPQ